MMTTTSNAPLPTMQMATRMNRRGSITQRRNSVTSSAAIHTRRNRRASITMRRSSIATSGSTSGTGSGSNLSVGKGGAESNDNMIGLVECDEVRALALKLTPKLEAADQLFSELDQNGGGGLFGSSSHHDDNQTNEYSYDDYYGDDMYGEMESLERGSDLLRQELEQQPALGYEEMYGSFNDQQEEEEEEEDPEAVEITEEEVDSDNPQSSVFKTSARAKMAATTTRMMVGSTPEERRWYPIDSTALLMVNDLDHGDSSQHRHHQRQEIIIKEYCMSITDQACRHLFAGLMSEKQQQGGQERLSLSSPTNSHHHHQHQILPPVRTLTIRIRPDVTVNSVMDACIKALDSLEYSSSCTTNNAATDSSSPSYPQSMIIRNGGHVNATIIMKNGSTTNGDGSNKNHCYSVDIQLCTSKTDECERVLLIRVCHDSTTTEDDDKAAPATSSSSTAVEEDSSSTGHDAHKLSLRLRKCCKDIKEREAVVAVSKKTPRQSPQSSIHQQQQHALVASSCPSVKAGCVTFPSLNDVNDWPVIQSSDSMVVALCKELEACNVSYNTLSKFRHDGGCLLDEGYCTQIQQICREVMLLELRESSADLEESAVQAELCTANLIALLRPQFVAYGMAPPSHPNPGLPLREYPLNYSNGAATSTPSTWGKKVDDTLQQIQSWSADSHNKSSPVEMAEQAVQMIVEAFVKQDDEEQLARLARKKRQVRDRLSNMKAHQQAMIQALSESPTQKASKAADEFAAKTVLALEHDALSTKMNTIRQVPLLKVNIAVGRLPATAYVTANYIMFVKPQLLSWKGAGSNVSLFDLEKVTFHVQHQGEAKSLLNPLLPALMTVKDNNGQEVYCFRPSLKVSRLQSFLDIVKLSATAPAGKQGNERLKDRILKIMLS